ncbi:hypothetical protein OsI_18723 [Oryza sativa Indica Group]|uniref:Phosphoribosyltransferase domain-containing protein n=1 Tax=Oryza sativa subsp. indica TaxID=39946 RepID=B8AYY6_ORYSI|nr:hypothetical protein OsI_18723 [Oryza sativa Indica Group]
MVGGGAGADAGIDRVLWTEAEIAARVSEVAAELAADLRALREPAVVVGVATGAFLFLADLVEDIVDTGNTVSCLIAYLEKKGASSISVCTFLDKPARRTANFQLVGDGKFYRGFECPDSFVVGYGMDYAELYRNLPYVGVLKAEMYKKDTSN